MQVQGFSSRKLSSKDKENDSRNELLLLKNHMKQLKQK